jgi:SAM-dependent methyltransferase
MSNRTSTTALDIHKLYEAAVQNVDTDIAFACRVYTRHRKAAPATIREDFCGTAKLAARWVQKGPRHRAVGLDIDQPTLDWANANTLPRLTPRQRERLNLICGDVLEPHPVTADIIFALNFSFCIFKERPQLLRYFKQVHQALHPEGLFILDIYGGTESIREKSDDVRLIPGYTLDDGTSLPDFEYVWEQALFNPITHHTICHIHFEVPGHRPLKRAFTYNWRLWTLPELQELLLEAGFAKAEVYLHDFNDKGESDEIYRLRKHYENTEGWVAYVAGIK